MGVILDGTRNGSNAHYWTPSTIQSLAYGQTLLDAVGPAAFTLPGVFSARPDDPNPPPLPAPPEETEDIGELKEFEEALARFRAYILGLIANMLRRWLGGRTGRLDRQPNPDAVRRTGPEVSDRTVPISETNRQRVARKASDLETIEEDLADLIMAIDVPDKILREYLEDYFRCLILGVEELALKLVSYAIAAAQVAAEQQPVEALDPESAEMLKKARAEFIKQQHMQHLRRFRDKVAQKIGNRRN